MRIVATIRVPRSEAEAARASLAATFDSASAASDTLGIVVEQTPVIELLASEPTATPPDAGGGCGGLGGGAIAGVALAVVFALAVMALLVAFVARRKQQAAGKRGKSFLSGKDKQLLMLQSTGESRI